MVSEILQKNEQNKFDLSTPTYATFLKTGWWNSNSPTSGIYRYLQTKSNLLISICQSQLKISTLPLGTLYIQTHFTKNLKKELGWGIFIFADFDPKGYFHAVAFFTWDYYFLFKFIPGRCVTQLVYFTYCTGKFLTFNGWSRCFGRCFISIITRERKRNIAAKFSMETMILSPYYNLCLIHKESNYR